MGDLSIGIALPPHVYIPGTTPRHPEAWFDEIKQSVTPQTVPSELHLTEAFKAGRAYFDAGFFWECHEVLEAVWMRTSDPSPERDMVQALIQLANARLKLLMGRTRATLRLCDMVEAHLARCPRDGHCLGLEVNVMRTWVKETQDVAKAEL